MPSAAPGRMTPLDHDEYLRHRDSLVLSYTESMKEYDRLVTWASAGALGLSITFIEKFGQNADRRTAWLLGMGWIALGLAFSTSLWSQYASSRVHSWRLRELDHLQLEVADRLENWANEAIRLRQVAGTYGSATRRLTFMSGVLLVGGIMLVATFAFMNAPLKPADDGTGNLEKKGAEYIPEPVRRPVSAPVSTPASTPAPIEKRTTAEK